MLRFPRRSSEGLGSTFVCPERAHTPNDLLLREERLISFRRPADQLGAPQVGIPRGLRMLRRRKPRASVTGAQSNERKSSAERLSPVNFVRRTMRAA